MYTLWVTTNIMAESFDFKTMREIINFIKNWKPLSKYTQNAYFLLDFEDIYLLVAEYKCESGKITKRKWYCKFLNEADAEVEP